MRRVVVIGPTMPPVHGAALVTARVARLLTADDCDVVWVSRNTTSLERGTRYYLTTIANLARAVGRAARVRSTADLVYVACSGGLGIVLEGFCIWIARRRGVPLVVHHHNFNYLNSRSRVYELVQRAAFRGATHVALCRDMADRLRQIGADDVVVVSNVATLDQPAEAPNATTAGHRSRTGLRLGHVSNLSVDKGLDRLLALLAEVPDEVSLWLYGAAQTPSDQALIDEALVRHPTRLHVVDPVDRAAVWRFLSEIDVFVFPSRFANEAAPLVVYEALSAGLPVLATPRGCIPSQLTPHLEMGIIQEQTFVDDASGVIRSMLEPGALHEWQRRAAHQWAVHLAQLEADRATLGAVLAVDDT